MLKDIFPQNAVDLGMFGENSLFYKYFRKKEVQLYKTSDYIGCMSPANVEFVLKHNDFVDKNGNVGTYNTGLNAEIKGYNNKAMNTNITHTME